MLRETGQQVENRRLANIRLPDERDLDRIWRGDRLALGESLDQHLGGFAVSQRDLGIEYGHDDSPPAAVLDDFHLGTRRKAQRDDATGKLSAAAQLPHNTARPGEQVIQRF
jgi:hypothetical protein